MPADRRLLPEVNASEYSSYTQKLAGAVQNQTVGLETLEYYFSYLKAFTLHINQTE